MIYADLRRFCNIPTLYTQRLTLRRLNIGDLEDVYAYCSDPRVSEYLLWEPHLNIRATQKYLALVDKKYRRAQFYDWGVEYCGHIIGTCGFTSFSLADNSAQIGYVLGSKYWGLGIATEVAQRVIRYGFEELRLNRIEGRYMAQNSASLAVMRKCRMSYEGTHSQLLFVKGRYRDIGVCAITAGEYFSNTNGTTF